MVSAIVVAWADRSLAVLAISPALAAISSAPAEISDVIALVSRAEPAIVCASRRSSMIIAPTARLNRPISSSADVWRIPMEKSPAATASAASAISRVGFVMRRCRN